MRRREYTLEKIGVVSGTLIYMLISINIINFERHSMSGLFMALTFFVGLFTWICFAHWYYSFNKKLDIYAYSRINSVIKTILFIIGGICVFYTPTFFISPLFLYIRNSALTPLGHQYYPSFLFQGFLPGYGGEFEYFLNFFFSPFGLSLFCLVLSLWMTYTHSSTCFISRVYHDATECSKTEGYMIPHTRWEYSTKVDYKGTSPFVTTSTEHLAPTSVAGDIKKQKSFGVRLMTFGAILVASLFLFPIYIYCVTRAIEVGYIDWERTSIKLPELRKTPPP